MPVPKSKFMKLITILLFISISGYSLAQNVPAGFVENYYSAYSNTPTAEKLIPFYADSVVIDDPTFDWVGKTKNEIFKNFDKNNINSHYTWHIYQQIVRNDTLITEGLLQAIYAGFPYEMRFVNIFHFQKGKIVRQYDYYDNKDRYKTVEQFNKINNQQLDRSADKGDDTPVSLVQRQLNAYNARDIEAFLEPYDKQVELYDYKTGNLILKGKEAMRTRYAFFTKVPELHCELKTRIVQGNVVIDKERITGFGEKVLEATAIYHIADNKIVKVFFIQ